MENKVQFSIYFFNCLKIVGGNFANSRPRHQSEAISPRWVTLYWSYSFSSLQLVQGLITRILANKLNIPSNFFSLFFPLKLTSLGQQPKTIFSTVYPVVKLSKYSSALSLTKLLKYGLWVKLKQILYLT